MRLQRMAMILVAAALTGSSETVLGQCFDQVGNGYIGVYFDAAGTQPCSTIPPFTSTTLHVIAKLAGESASGITVAEFRLEFSTTAMYFISWSVNPLAAGASIGSPVDDTPADPNDAKGALVAFPSCQPDPPGGSQVSLGTLSVFNQGGGPITILTKKKTPPGSPEFTVPFFVKCDAPTFTKVPLTLFENQVGGRETVAFKSFINTPACDPCPAPPPMAPLGIYPDSLAAERELCVDQGQSKKFYLLGVVPDAQPPGITGAEFRVEVANPTGYAFLYGPPQNAQVFGNPLDLTPANPNDATGCTIIFSTCQPTPEAHVGNLVGLGTLTVFNQGGGPTALRIRQMQPPGSPSMPCPRFFLCDSPFNTPECMSPIISDDIVFFGMLNDSSCTEPPPPPFATEHLQLDLHDPADDGSAGPVSTTQPLDSGEWFLITVQGTGSLTNASSWFAPPSVLCGVPERPVMTPSPGLENYWTGADAEIHFAAALPQGSNCSQMVELGYPRHHARFRVDLGAGFTDLEPLGGSPTDPSPGHRYRYLVQGQQSQARFAWEETTTSDDYGILQITVEPVNPTDVAQEMGSAPLPNLILMLANVPDPFNPSTEIRYLLPAPTTVQVGIFDIRGRLIRHVFEGPQGAGLRSVRWDGRNHTGAPAPSGSYFARVTTPLGIATERVTLLK